MIEVVINVNNELAFRAKIETDDTLNDPNVGDYHVKFVGQRTEFVERHTQVRSVARSLDVVQTIAVILQRLLPEYYR